MALKYRLDIGEDNPFRDIREERAGQPLVRPRLSCEYCCAVCGCDLTARSATFFKRVSFRRINEVSYDGDTPQWETRIRPSVGKLQALCEAHCNTVPSRFYVYPFSTRSH